MIERKEGCRAWVDKHTTHMDHGIALNEGAVKELWLAAYEARAVLGMISNAPPSESAVGRCLQGLKDALE